MERQLNDGQNQHDKDKTIEHWDNQQFISDQKSFGFRIEQWKQLLPLNYTMLSTL